MRCRPQLLGIGIALLALCVGGAARAESPRGPFFVAHDEQQGRLLVLTEKQGALLSLDPVAGTIEKELPLGEWPYELEFHPDGRRIYVSCRGSQEILELDREQLEVLRRFPLRGSPSGLAFSTDGTQLLVALNALDRVAVMDLETGTELKRLLAGHAPTAVEAWPGRDEIHVASLLPARDVVGRPPRNELTVIDARRGRIAERIEMVNANIARQIAFTEDGAYGLVSISRPKNLVPMVQVARGWVVTNGFALLRPGREPLQLLVDLPNQSFADPYGVAWTPDGEKAYLTASGVDMVLAIDRDSLLEVEGEIDAGKLPRAADHLGLSRRYVVSRTRVGANPVSVTVDAKGERAYVANRLDDTISVLDAHTDELIDTFVLSDLPPAHDVRLGEQLFHSGLRTFQDQFSCASCHPDNGVDGLQYDLEPDGIGLNILDNRNMRGLTDTSPFKWTGTNPDITTQCGTRTAKWIVRTGWLDPVQVVALSDYIHSITEIENPYLADDGRLTKAQRRGKKIFERTEKKNGEPIPEEQQCHFCHSGPKRTNRERFDVGLKSPTDTKTEFDTAHLVNLFDSAPYLHDGRASTLEEIWTVNNAGDTHGFSSDWTKQQLNDLVEYLKVLGPPGEESP